MCLISNQGFSVCLEWSFCIVGVNRSQFFLKNCLLLNSSVHFSAILPQHKLAKVIQGQLLKEQPLR